MAPAEVAAAGCVVFVPNRGGQVEIVDHDSRLLYRDVDDAVGLISGVIHSPALQDELRSTLAINARRFSLERFVRDYRQIVECFPSRPAAPTAPSAPAPCDGEFPF